MRPLHAPPSKAASGFFSNILREPLVGQEAVLPVPETVRHWHASPRSAVEFLIRAATLDGQQVGPRRTLSMPGLSATVGEQIEALRRVAGERAVRLIRREPDESIMRIVESWPTALDATRAVRLGFAAENSFDEIIRVHIDDELPRLPLSRGSDRKRQGINVRFRWSSLRSAVSHSPTTQVDHKTGESSQTPGSRLKPGAEQLHERTVEWDAEMRLALGRFALLGLRPGLVK